MNVLKPALSYQDISNPFISVAQSGLKQIYCQFVVTKGTYQGVSFRQNITLPASIQNIDLASSQEKACQIGAAMLKAICLAANKPTKVQSVNNFTGMRFPVKVKISSREKQGQDGRVFWNNEIALIITPSMEEYERVRSLGEIINPNGAVTGTAKSSQSSHREAPQPETEIDTMPF